MIAKCKARLLRLCEYSSKVRANLEKLILHEGRVNQFLMFTQEIMANHGYNVTNVEEGNHEEIKKGEQMFLGPEGIHDDEVRDPSWRGTSRDASGFRELEASPTLWRWIGAAGVSDQVPGWVTIPDPTVPQTRRWSTPQPKTPPGPPAGYKQPPPQPKPRPPQPPQPPPGTTRTTPPEATSGSSRAEPKLAAKSMPRRDVPVSEFVNADKLMSMALYNKIFYVFYGCSHTAVRFRLNIDVSTGSFALSHT